MANFITPINPSDPFSQIGKVGQTPGGISTGFGGARVENDTYSFENVLTDAIGNVETTGQNVIFEAEKLATGQTDNLHDITIASTEANLAVQLFVQLRNKTVSAYKELMNLNI